MDHPYRKELRLKNYDYSNDGAYFITICTMERKQILSCITRDRVETAPDVIYTEIGLEIIGSIEFLNRYYNYDVFNKYVIMPNHIHCIIVLKTGGRGSPPLHDIIKRLKTFTTKRYCEFKGSRNEKLWQRNYYEHVIRSEQDYLDIWEYIDNNPRNWSEDEYH